MKIVKQKKMEMCIDMKVIKKEWGNERIYKNDDNYCVKLLTVNQGKSCSIHYHKQKEESFLMCQGKILLEIWEKIPENATQTDLENIAKTKPIHRYVLQLYSAYELNDNSVITIKSGTPHRFTGLLDGDNAFYEASTKDSVDDSFRATKSLGLY